MLHLLGEFVRENTRLILFGIGLVFLVWWQISRHLSHYRGWKIRFFDVVSGDPNGVKSLASLYEGMMGSQYARRVLDDPLARMDYAATALQHIVADETRRKVGHIEIDYEFKTIGVHTIRIEEERLPIVMVEDVTPDLPGTSALSLLPEHVQFLIKSQLPAQMRAYVLTWYSRLEVPAGALVAGNTIKWTQGGNITDQNGRLIGRYVRLIEFGGAFSDLHKMLVFVAVH